jgi:hypothetical protein
VVSGHLWRSEKNQSKMKKDFWTGTNRMTDDETRYGTVGIELSGSDWLGLGAISEGNAFCGSKPMCWSFSEGDNCSTKMRAYESCVANSLTLQQQQLQVKSQELSGRSSAEESETKRTLILAVSGLLAVAVIMTAFILVKRKK